jgi:hypothetical protein
MLLDAVHCTRLPPIGETRLRARFPFPFTPVDYREKSEAAS